MSSHHIVKEKQEPALLVLDLDGFDDEWLGQLLEWNPTVIATVETAEQLNIREIKIDLLLCEDACETSQPGIKCLFLMKGDPVKTAMEWLMNNNYPAVNIIVKSFEPERFKDYQHTIDLVIFCQSTKIYPVSSGFNKWKPAGELVWIISDAHNFQTSGLKQIDQRTFITINNALIQLNFSNKFIFIGEDL